MASFVTNSANGVFSVTIPKPFVGTVAEEMLSESKAWLLQPEVLYILDFTGHEDIKPDVYRAVVLLQQTLTKNGRKLASLGISQKIQRNLVADGVSAAFSSISSVEEAKARFLPSPAQPQAIDTRFVRPFIDSTLKTLKVQANTEARIGKPFLRKPEELRTIPIDIAGVISLASDHIKGTITIGFPENVFLQIYENMFGEKVGTINSEIQDAASEILNIIYGGAKTELNQTQGCDFKPALPTVLSGANLSIRLSSHLPTIVLPFETMAGLFLIEVAIERI